MKIFYILTFSLFVLFICKFSFSKDVFDSEFISVKVTTSNADETKNESINNIKKISLIKLIDKILDRKSVIIFNKIIESNISSNKLIKNIIIENEIITNEKYIANIKVNFDKEKIINLFRNNKLNYNDLLSKPFLFISSVNIDFDQIALDNKYSFNNFAEKRSNQNNELINYIFPNLDTNDRYILPYETIIKEEKSSYNLMLNKYNLTQLIYINISKTNTMDHYNIIIKTYYENGFKVIGDFKIKENNSMNTNELFDFLSVEVLQFVNNWWKNKYIIDNNIYNEIQCKILSQNINELVSIKSTIQNFTQVKYLKIKNIQLNSNNVIIFYYGDIKVLKKKLSFLNLQYEEKDGCTISADN